MFSQVSNLSNEISVISDTGWNLYTTLWYVWGKMLNFNNHIHISNSTLIFSFTLELTTLVLSCFHSPFSLPVTFYYISKLFPFVFEMSKPLWSRSWLFATEFSRVSSPCVFFFFMFIFFYFDCSHWSHSKLSPPEPPVNFPNFEFTKFS